MKFFHLSVRLTMKSRARLSVRSINQSNRSISNRSISVRLSFLFCSRAFISRSYENRSITHQNDKSVNNTLIFFKAYFTAVVQCPAPVSVGSLSCSLIHVLVSKIIITFYYNNNKLLNFQFQLSTILQSTFALWTSHYF